MMQESRLRRYDHVKRRPPDYVGNVALQFSHAGRWFRGSNKTGWKSAVQKDMRDARFVQTMSRIQQSGGEK